MIEFKPYIKDLHQRIICSQFEKDHFFYDTHLPELITTKEVDELLNYSDSYLSVIYMHSKLVGLCDFIIEKKMAKIEMQFFDRDIDKEEAREVLYLYCRRIFDDYQVSKITKYVYEFDEKGREIYEESKFYKEGEYNKYIYKNYNYWNVYVYSMLKEELN